MTNFLKRIFVCVMAVSVLMISTIVFAAPPTGAPPGSGSGSGGSMRTLYLDADGDGYGDEDATGFESGTSINGYVTNNSDCDDNDSSIHPGATEACNTRDDDCDGDTDEGLTSTYYRDLDRDTYGDSSTTAVGCSRPTGYSANDDDCDDDADSIHPRATETCNSVDDDCDGTVDDGLTIATYFVDADGDGYANTSDRTLACSAPTGYVLGPTLNDCDDTDATVHPGATERCNRVDDDCDGTADDNPVSGGTTYYLDGDGDGAGSSSRTIVACSEPSGYGRAPDDCDDNTEDVSPYADEFCDGVDNDCDGVIDTDVSSGGTTYYADADEDGVGDASSTVVACSAPEGHVTTAGDCDDTTDEVAPGRGEVCNGVDDDCNGTVDDNPASGTTYYVDADGDGYGDPAVTQVACSQPAGYSLYSGDCNDAHSSANPGRTHENCDGLDNDCDGTVDEDPSDGTTYYADTDEDSYGDATFTTRACSQPTDYVADSSDCDDTTDEVAPGRGEVCNGLDDDCDGTTDEDDASDAITWFADVDGDGYGSGDAVRACAQPAGHIAFTTDVDCNDANAAVNPAAAETAGDGIDQDCDGADLAAEPTASVCVDADGDGYITSAPDLSDPLGTLGTTPCGDDCDDADASVFPGAAERCNTIDDNCDGAVDEATARDATIWYADGDGDGFGDSALLVGVAACTQPASHVADKTDCDDSRADVNPIATEVCDGFDNDCSLTVDDITTAATYYADTDADGYGDLSAPHDEMSCTPSAGLVANSTDCDDADTAFYPGAEEDCADLNDYNCDGSVGYANVDGDAFAACEECDDSDADINPGAAEQCLTVDIDDDCDGTADEPDAIDASTWYVDTDSDSYGLASLSQPACVQPIGYVFRATDCDDANSAAYPNATETCGNGIDENCDGLDLSCTVVGGGVTGDTTGTVIESPTGIATGDLAEDLGVVGGDADGDGDDDVADDDDWSDFLEPVAVLPPTQFPSGGDGGDGDDGDGGSCSLSMASSAGTNGGMMWILYFIIVVWRFAKRLSV